MPEFPTDTNEVERTKQQIRELVAEIGQLARSELDPRQFYPEFLNRVVAALAAVGGAVWTLEPGGSLKLQYQLNMPPLGDGGSNGDATAHTRLLSQVLAIGTGTLVPPRSGLTEGDESDGLANPTDHLLVLGAVTMNRQPAGVVEIFQRPNSRPATQRGYLQFLTQMCTVAGDFLKNRQLRHMADRQHLWGQLESFSEEVHRHLDLKQVAYTVANEGRRLVQSDRVSVVLRHGRRSVVEAISGQDMVDRRANLVRQMRRLTDTVIRTGEPLYYYGDTEELAPTVEQALADYVDESGSKSIIIEPLRPTADGTEEPPCIGAVVVERIEDSTPDAVMVERVQILTRHSTSALKNALEHHRVFLLPVWKALGNVSSLFRGRRGAQVGIVFAVLAALVAALFLIPWHFRPHAKGDLLPRDRANVFAPADDLFVLKAPVKHGQRVKEGEPLVWLYSYSLEVQREQTAAEYDRAKAEIASIRSQLRLRQPQDEQSLKYQLQGYEDSLPHLEKQMALLDKQAEDLTQTAPMAGIITTWGVDEILRPRTPVRRGQVLLEVADDSGDWVAEVKMPEERMGHVLAAWNNCEKNVGLPVEFILASQPDQSYRGFVRKVAQRAHLTASDGNVAVLTIEPHPDDLPKLKPEIADFAVIGAEVTAKVDCGPRSLGYVLFVDVIEFIQAEILFRFR